MKLTACVYTNDILFLLPSKYNFPKYNGNHDNIQDHLKASIKKHHFNSIMAIISAMCFIMLYAYICPILPLGNILMSLCIRTLNQFPFCC